MLTVVAGGALAQFLTTHVPEWSAGTLLEDLGGAVEFPVYAIIIGLVLNAVLSALGIRGRLAGEDSLQIASIVKLTQNALIGVVAVALTAWFALRVERDESAPRIRAIDFWHRFPKFVLGFIAASVAVTVAAEFLSEADLDGVDSAVKGFRDYFLTLAFVSVGLEFEAKALREAGMKPVAVFAAATLFDIVLGLALATLLFSNFEV